MPNALRDPRTQSLLQSLRTGTLAEANNLPSVGAQQEIADRWEVALTRVEELERRLRILDTTLTDLMAKARA